jgi:hypothetical protein
VFKVHKPVLVSDPVEALENEAGFFEVTAPTGETMEIRLENGHIRIQGNFCCPGNMRGDQLWQIVKVGELGAENAEPITAEGESGVQIQ